MNTETLQNSLARLHHEVDLDMPNANPVLKRQYFKACQTLDKARHEFDLLNGMKEDFVKMGKG